MAQESQERIADSFETPTRDRRAEVLELLRIIGKARKDVSAVMAECGIDPEDWGRLVDPERFTRENRRRMTYAVQRAMNPVLEQARKASAP